jgi:hypothetical protein
MQISKNYILFEIDRSVFLPSSGWISIENNIKCITYSNDERNTSFSYGFGAWGYFSYGSSGAGTLPLELEGRKQLLKVNSFQTDLRQFIQVDSFEDLRSSEYLFYFDIPTQILYVNFQNTQPGDYQYLAIGATKGYSNIEGYYGNLFYEGRIRSAPSISIKKDNQYYGIMTYDTGSIVLNNTDGAFDNFRDEDIYGAVVKVLSSTSVDYESFETIYSGYLDSFSLSTRDLNIVMRDTRKVLEEKVVKNIFTGVVNDKIEDKMIPLAWGKIKDAPAYSLNEGALANYTFKFVDTSQHLIKSIDQVYVDSVKVTHSASSLSAGTFVLSSSVYKPGQKVTVDFEGYEIDGTLIENPLQIIEELCSLINIPYNNFYFDTTHWETVKNSGLPACNLYVGESTSAIDLINQLSNSIFGLFLLTPDGKFTYKIKDVDAPTKSTITVSELLTPPSLNYSSDSYVSTVNVGYSRRYSEKETYNYFRNSTKELELKEKYRVSKTQYFPTQLTNRADAEVYSNKVLDEFGGIFPEYTFDTKIYHSDIDILDIVEVELYKFTDNSYGKVKIIIIGVSLDYNTNRITFTGRWLEDVTAHIDLATFIKWQPGVSYLQGAVVQSDGQLWRAIVPSIDNKPVPDSAFWSEFGMLFWQDYVIYPINAIAAEDGVLYRAIRQNLNSSPSSNPLDWEILNSGGSGGAGSVEWVATYSYKDGNIVFYNSTWWESLLDDNLGVTPEEGSYWTKINNFSVNAATATKLATSRTIQGVGFDGTANINIINGTGFVKASGTTLSYDNTTYLPSASYTPTAAVLSGYVAASGTITSSDTIETAIEKLGFDKHVAVTLATNHGLSLSGQVIGLGTPSSVTNSSTNSVTTTTHTHAVSGLTTSNLSATAGITNAQLANSSITVGTTAIPLGSSATTITGLTSVTSTTFVGALTGTASGNVPLSGASYIQATGLSTSWGVTSGVNTGGHNTLMGVASGATWLLSGTSGGTFRGGIQLLDDGTSMRLYNGANYISISGSTITGSLTGTASGNLALTGGTVTGSTTFNEPAAGYLKVASTAAPTVDLVQISNTGFGTVTAGTSALNVDYVGGAAAIEASASRFNVTPGSTSGGTWNSIRLVNGASASGVTTNGIKFDTKTAGAGTANGIWIGTGWDNILNYNGTTVINGTGNVIAGQLSGTIPSAVLGASSLYIGTTAVALNRASAALALTGLDTVQSTGLAVSDGNSVYIPTPKGGGYKTTTATVTGAIKVTLPQSWTSTMMKFDVEIYEYTTGESFTVKVAGYNYITTPSWINTSVQTIGTSTGRDFTVRFGHDGTKCCVYIGELASTWSYPQIRVTNFVAGFGGETYTSWDDGWVIGFEPTAFGTITSTHTSTLIAAAISRDSTEWNGAAKTISASDPSGGADGDIWYKTSYTGAVNITIGTTVIPVDTTTLTLAGLTSVTATSFVGTLTGNVSGNSNTATRSTQSLIGTCTTAQATAAKVVTLSNWVLEKGAEATIVMTNGATASSTLNINGTGAKTLYKAGAVTTTGAWAAGGIIKVIYDGTYFHQTMTKAGGATTAPTFP